MKTNCVNLTIFCLLIFSVLAVLGCNNTKSSSKIYEQMITEATNDFRKYYGDAEFFQIDSVPIVLLAKLVDIKRDKNGDIIELTETCFIFHSQYADWIPISSYKSNKEVKSKTGQRFIRLYDSILELDEIRDKVYGKEQ